MASGQDPFQFQSSRGCVTVLANPQGQVSADPSQGAEEPVGLTRLELMTWPDGLVGPQRAPSHTLRDSGLKDLHGQH